jgi:ArsR family transcriptional regulator
MNKVFQALNDPTRRKILQLLKDQSLSAGEIADQFSISKPSISHHLDLLKQAELVDVKRDGQFIIYSINTTVLEEMMSWLFKLTEKEN